jgi:galactose mutarotase-like enzyme
VFSITSRTQHYQTWCLASSDGKTQLDVVPERGGIVTRWVVQGHEILYLDTERFTHPELSVRGGIPILFPICGNLPSNTYQWEGQSYTLSQHGFARNLAWTVTGQKVTQHYAELTVAIASSDETRAVYPFDFEVAFTYRLEPNHLTIEQSYTNQSDRVMPFSTGVHPYFQVQDKDTLSFNLPAQAFQPKDDPNIYPFTGGFDFQQPEIDIAFKPLHGQSATVKDGDRQLCLTMEWDEHYSTLVFWTVQGQPYYCLEPWSAPRNALNTGEHLTHLPPEESISMKIRMGVTLLDSRVNPE